MAQSSPIFGSTSARRMCVLKPLALPRGLRQFRKFKELKKSGTLNRSTQALCFLPPVSHQRDLQLHCEVLAPANAIWAACRLPFTPRRSTALFCSPRCRKAAQRARDRGIPVRVPATRPSVAPDAFLSVTATIGISEEQKTQGVTLRQPRKPPNINPRIAADPKWPGMYRIRRPDSSLTDMVSLTRRRVTIQAQFCAQSINSWISRWTLQRDAKQSLRFG